MDWSHSDPKQAKHSSFSRGLDRYCLEPSAFNSGARFTLSSDNYVLLRRFSAKEQERRLTAAPVFARDLPSKQVGLENHLNYIYKPSGALTEDEAIGLAALLNSRLLDNWFRAINGNTQVSATEIRSMPLPSVAIIRAIGVEAKNIPTLAAIDDLVEQMTAYEERIPVSA